MSTTQHRFHAVRGSRSTPGIRQPSCVNAEIPANGIRNVSCAVEEGIPVCALPMPTPPAGQTVSADRVNVLYIDPNGQTVLILRSDAAECSDGWRFDGDSIALCSNTCSKIVANYTASLEVLGACDTITAH